MAVRRTAALAERELLGEYPFLPGAEALAAELAPSIRDLLAHPAHSYAREVGRSRILAAADDPTGATVVADLARAGPEVRFLSFYYARLLLSAAATPAPLRRWAVAEAKQAYARWERSSADELADLASRLGFGVEPAAGEVSISVPDYVRLATPIREADFRLARQTVRAGRVHVDRTRAARLLQEAVRLSLTRPIPLDEPLREAIRSQESEFLAGVAQRMPLPTRPIAPGAIGLRPDLFPPCIRKMQRTLQAGENLSHSGRFALAAFLHRAGADFETIVDAYRGAPDFDESITRYQVEHITLRNDGEGYTPPECDTLRAHGLCARDGDPTAPAVIDRGRDERCFDPALRHPLGYYRMRGGVTREGPAPRAPAEGPGTPRGLARRP